MIFTDTHAHVYSEEFINEYQVCFARTLENKVSRVFVPNVDVDSIKSLNAVCGAYKEYYYPMMGLHPCSVKEDYKDQLGVIYDELVSAKYYAVGEIGMDLYWDKTFIEEQKHAFITQIEWALAFNYPIVIHCRDAFDEIFSVLTSFPKLPKAIFHCFSGNYEQAKKIIDLGNFKLGIGGVLTFKNSGLDKIVEKIDLEHFVLETDAPYLAPNPFRGKRNEPSYLLEITKKLAEIKNISMVEVAETTSKNADFIFKKG